MRAILNYSIRQHDGQAKLYIDQDRESGEANLEICNRLHARKRGIEESFGGPLQWKALEGKRACRIQKTIAVAGWRDEEEWAEAQDQMVDAMIPLERALRPDLQDL